MPLLNLIKMQRKLMLLFQLSIAFQNKQIYWHSMRLSKLHAQVNKVVVLQSLLMKFVHLLEEQIVRQLKLKV